MDKPTPVHMIPDGPLASEFKYRFKKKDRRHLDIPTPPKQMEWLEEPELARSLYDIAMMDHQLEK